MKGKRRKKNGGINKELLLFVALVVVLAIVFIVASSKKETIKTSSTSSENNELVTAQDETNTIDEHNETEVNQTKENSIDLTNLSEDQKLGSNGLPILMYHFFYDKSKGETAKDGNWLEVSIFEEHLKYLTENDFFFPTWEQVADYVEGKIDLPKKSVVLTVDDGEDSFFEVALPVVKKYDVKVTEFLVTSWNGWYKDDYPAKQMSYQSHSRDMHKGGANGKGAIVNWSYSEILEDLKESRDSLGDECIAFCYPFGHYNDNAQKAVKEAGYRVAVTTEGGRAKKGSNPYALPRVRTSSGTTLEVFKGLVE